jgi:cysteinyl-tRNA synthetase
VRAALLAHHYRHDSDWTGEDLAKASSRVATWRSTVTSSRHNDVLDEVRAALDAHPDTPSALEAIDLAAQSGYNVAAAAATLLGVTL